MLEYFIWTSVSKLRWKLNLNWYISLQENAFENVRKMTAILSRPRYFKVKLVVHIFCCVRFVAPDIFSCVLKMELKSNQMYQILIYSGNDTGKMQLAIRTSIHWYFVYLQVRIGFVVFRLGMQGWAEDRKKTLLRPGQNARYFTGDILGCISCNKNCSILLNFIARKSVLKESN